MDFVINKFKKGTLFVGDGNYVNRAKALYSEGEKAWLIM